MTAPITVIADDYALSSGVSAGILDLARRGGLSGTGAMVPSPRWAEDARALHDVPHGFQTGVHLTLTGPLSPLGPMPRLCPQGQLPSLRRWLLLSHAGLLAPPSVRSELLAEIERQLDRFEQAMGRAPHFVDGHQHVHLLPGVRRLVLAALHRRYSGQKVWLRDCAEPVGRITARGVAVGKALFIAGLARGLAGQAARLGIAVNHGFAGIYDFRGDYAALMARFLSGAPAGAVIMVHPALGDDELAALDPVVDARQAEWAYLSGAAWPEQLERAGRSLFRG